MARIAAALIAMPAIAPMDRFWLGDCVVVGDVDDGDREAMAAWLVVEDAFVEDVVVEDVVVEDVVVEDAEVEDVEIDDVEIDVAVLEIDDMVDVEVDETVLEEDVVKRERSAS